MYTLIANLYVLLPKLMTFVCAEEYNPFKGCDFSDRDGLMACKVASPSFHLSNPLGSLQDWLTNFASNIVLASLKVGSVDVFQKTDGHWNYPGVGAIVDFFEHFSLLMLALGIVFALIEAGIAYMNGQGNLSATAVNISKAIIYKFIYTELAIQVFAFILNISGALALAIVANSGAGSDGMVAITATGAGATAYIAIHFGAFLASITSTSVVAWPVVLLLIIMIIFSYIKFVWTLAKRSVVFLSILAEGCLIPFSVARGYAGESQSYAKKLMTFFIGCILNVTFYYIGAAMLFEAPFGNSDGFWGSIGAIATGFAFMFCAEKVYGFLGTAGEGAGPGGALGNFLHFADHAKNLFGSSIGSATSSDGAANSIAGSTS